MFITTEWSGVWIAICQNYRWPSDFSFTILKKTVNDGKSLVNATSWTSHTYKGRRSTSSVSYSAALYGFKLTFGQSVREKYIIYDTIKCLCYPLMDTVGNVSVMTVWLDHDQHCTRKLQPCSLFTESHLLQLCELCHMQLTISKMENIG